VVEQVVKVAMAEMQLGITAAVEVVQVETAHKAEVVVVDLALIQQVVVLQ
jgi:hypothetical protein